jgi:hypothetical protein
MNLTKPEDDAGWAERRRWKAVRLDLYTDLPGIVSSANSDTGEIVMQVPDGDGTKLATWNLPCGFRIVKR